jgi:hypothetical protein
MKLHKHKILRGGLAFLFFLVLLLSVSGCSEPAVEEEFHETGAPSSITDVPLVEEKASEGEPEKTAKETVQPMPVATCHLSITCQQLVVNLSRLPVGKQGLVPGYGEILPLTEFNWQEGDTVFDLLQRGTRQQGIHMEFTRTPIYNSTYIEGIHNLYEFDAGELSGWMYRVNGVFPNRGASAYVLKAGDVVEWIFTLDLGRDVGGDYLEQKGE